MKIISIFALLFLVLNQVYSQTSVLELSSGFEEPHKVQLFQCSNGNTFFIQMNRHDEIECTVYDKARKVIGKKEFQDKRWIDFRFSVVEGIYEINKEVVLFLRQGVRNRSDLFRIRVNSVTGNLIAIELIRSKERADLHIFPWAPGFPVQSTFYVIADKNNERYAVVISDGYSRNPDGRISIVHYDNEHKAIDSATLICHETDNDHLYVIDMLWKDKDNLYLCMYANNIGRHDMPGSHFILSKFTSGSGKIENLVNEVDYHFMNICGKMAYDSVKDLLYVINTAHLRPQSKFLSQGTVSLETLLSCYRLGSFNLKYIRPVSMQKATSQYGNNWKIGDFFGYPVDLVVDDGKVVIPFQRRELGDLAIVTVNDDAESVDALVVKKSQPGSTIGAMNQVSDRRISRTKLGNMADKYGFIDQNFHSNDLIFTDHGLFVIMNAGIEVENSLDVLPGHLSTNNTVCIKYSGGKAQRSKLYGEPDAAFKNRFSFIDSGHYQPSTNTYVSVIVENTKKGKTAYVAWTKLE